MFARAIQGIVKSKDFARAVNIDEAAHFSKTNPSAQPNRWKKAGPILRFIKALTCTLNEVALRLANLVFG
jgi:hypothetical protein